MATATTPRWPHDTLLIPLRTSLAYRRARLTVMAEKDWKDAIGSVHNPLCRLATIGD